MERMTLETIFLSRSFHLEGGLRGVWRGGVPLVTGPFFFFFFFFLAGRNDVGIGISRDMALARPPGLLSRQPTSHVSCRPGASPGDASRLTSGMRGCIPAADDSAPLHQEYHSANTPGGNGGIHCTQYMLIVWKSASWQDVGFHPSIKRTKVYCTARGPALCMTGNWLLLGVDLWIDNTMAN